MSRKRDVGCAEILPASEVAMPSFWRAATGLGLSALGNVRGETMRAFNAEEMKSILDKIPAQ